jgi:Spy/CpxP family protein refolding chaperone
MQHMENQKNLKAQKNTMHSNAEMTQILKSSDKDSNAAFIKLKKKVKNVVSNHEHS